MYDVCFYIVMRLDKIDDYYKKKKTNKM